MRRFVLHTSLFALLFVLATPSVGLAWSNGWLGDGYGTHDWILDEALALSGESWVDRDAALLTTDDPDTEYGSSDFSNHVFRPTGDGRGAPQTVADYYYQAQVAYQANDMVLASQLLGILSHYYADITVPFHVSVKDDAVSDTHLAYELEVDDMTGFQGENSDWITPVARQAVTDVRARTVSAAYATRTHYDTLLAQYQANGYNGTVASITEECLSRAANDLADIIQSIPTGAGLTSAGSVTADGPYTYVGQNKLVLATGTVTDDLGAPVEGARVVFDWPLPGGTVSDIEYTGADGVAESWVNIQNAPLMTDLTVTGTTTSGSDYASDSVTFIPTPVIGYIRTIVPYYRPAQGTLVTASTLILDEDGKPIEGLEVTFTWTHKSTVIEYTTTTDEWGMARHYRNIGNTTAEYLVSVRAQTQSGSINRSSTATFLPKASTGLTYNTTGVSGSNRFGTAATVSARAYPSGSSTVLIATGMNWPDALGGAALAGAYDAPILLSGRTYLPDDIADEIDRLGATRAVILGGKGAVGTGVENDLRAAGITSISRVGGDSRYTTARAVAQAAISRTGAAYEGVAFVATGQNFPDALAASSISAFRKWPIYLADPGGSASTLASQMYADGVREVIMLGGTGTVSQSYQRAFESRFGSVTRLGGSDRYETGTIIAEYGVASVGLGWDGVPVATGSNFPDALAGGVLAARKRTVMLLTDGNVLPTSVRDVLTANKDDIGTIHYLGGSGSVSNDVRAQIGDALD